MARVYRDCLPAGLWEHLGPPMRPRLVQAGKAGPFVIRGNPVGAVLDTIRGYCFPVAMEEQEGGSFEDTEFGAFGSPGTDTYPALGAYTGPPGYYTGAVADDNRCGAGTVWDGANCVPDGMAVQPRGEDPCGVAHLQRARESLRVAIGACDTEGAQQVLDTAHSCRDADAGVGQAAWQRLAVEAKAAVEAITMRRKRGQCQRARIAGAMTAGDRAQANLPAVPATTQMTEGNVRMAPDFAPMGGMADPQPMRRRGFGRR